MEHQVKDTTRPLVKTNKNPLAEHLIRRRNLPGAKGRHSFPAMTIRQLMLALSKFDSHLEVMVTTSRPSALLDIYGVEETDPEKETRLVVLKCEGPSVH